MTEPKVLTRVEGRVLHITINRPEQRNAIDPETNYLLNEAIERFASDSEIWIAVLRGAGDKAFSAGGDLKAIDASVSGGPAYEIPAKGYGGLTARFDLTKPIIAVVNGLAYGGGFEIALAADIIIAAEHAKFALPEPKAGIFAAAGGVYRVVRQLPKKLAMELLLTGSSITAQQALHHGLVNVVTPYEELDVATENMIERILACAPLAVRATKEMADVGLEMSIEEATAKQARRDYSELAKLVVSNDVREGVRAFAEKRSPVWTAT